MNTGNRKAAKSLRGAVLMMVLTVMFVLIFLLAGSIAVVYSANNRAKIKFQESQAYYTARSVLDMYISDLLKDNDNVLGVDVGDPSYKVKAYAKNKKTGTIDEANAKQGRALELDLYDLCVDLSDVDGYQIDYDSIKGSNESHMYPWVKEFVLEVTATISSQCGLKKNQSAIDYWLDKTGATYVNKTYNEKLDMAVNACKAELNGVVSGNQLWDKYVKLAVQLINPTSDDFSTATDYLTTQKYYDQFAIEKGTGSKTTMTGDKITPMIAYQVPSSTLDEYGIKNDGSGYSYGKVADNDMAAIVKVEMVERKFDLGATNLGSYETATGDLPFIQVFDTGDRQEDYIKVKVTCSVTYNGDETTTSIQYRTRYEPATVKPTPPIAGGGAPGSSGAVYPGGKNHIDNDGTINFDATACGGTLVTEGSAYFNNSGSNLLYNPNEHMAIKKDLLVTNQFKLASDIRFSNYTSNTDEQRAMRGFVYVGGKLMFNNNVSIGAESVNGKASDSIDLLVREMGQDSRNSFNLVGDLYVEDFHFNPGYSGSNYNVNGDAYFEYIDFEADSLNALADLTPFTVGYSFPINGASDAIKLTIDSSGAVATATADLTSLPKIVNTPSTNTQTLCGGVIIRNVFSDSFTDDNPFPPSEKEKQKYGLTDKDMVLRLDNDDVHRNATELHIDGLGLGSGLESNYGMDYKTGDAYVNYKPAHVNLSFYDVAAFTFDQTTKYKKFDLPNRKVGKGFVTYEIETPQSMLNAYIADEEFIASSSYDAIMNADIANLNIYAESIYPEAGIISGGETLFVEKSTTDLDVNNIEDVYPGKTIILPYQVLTGNGDGTTSKVGGGIIPAYSFSYDGDTYIPSNTYISSPGGLVGCFGNFGSTDLMDILNYDFDAMFQKCENVVTAESEMDNAHMGLNIAERVDLTSGGNTPRKGKYYFLNSGSTVNCTIDATENDVVIDLIGSGSTRYYYGTIKIEGDRNVTFCMDNEGGSVKEVHFGDSGHNFQVYSVGTVVNPTYNGNELTGGDIIVGTARTGLDLSKVPEVDFYVGAGITTKFWRHSFITGYFYGPNASSIVNTDYNGITLNYIACNGTSDVKVINGGKSPVVGSVLFGSSVTANTDFWNIPRDTIDMKNGDVMFDWLDVLYLKGE